MFPCSIDNHPQVKVANDFEEWWSHKLEGQVNAVCWRRQLKGDYQAIINQLPLKEGVHTLEIDWLEKLQLEPEGEFAKTQLLMDYRLLLELGANPQMDVIFNSFEDQVSPVFPTHVHSWHVDRAPIEAETYLCTYHGDSSELVANQEAFPKVINVDNHQALWALSGAETEEEYADFLTEFSYDLHYDVIPTAEPVKFGMGNLWKVSVLYPDSLVLPCIHRAPHTRIGDTPRLLLIG